MPRAQPLPTRDAPYSRSSMVDDTDDYAPQHYALSSNGTYPRPRHSQEPSWSNISRTSYPDQDSYAALPTGAHGSYTLNPVDAMYTQAMMSSYESTVPLNATTSVFNPLADATIDRHQVLNGQDMIQDPMLALDMDDYPYSGLTMSNHGYPTPPMEYIRHPIALDDIDCTMPTSTVTHGRWTGQGVSMIDDIAIPQDVLPYDMMENDAFSRHG